MTALAREMSFAIVEEEGPAGLLRRLSDPFWFQAFGCVLGFDWHSSGLTTTVCGALKEGLYRFGGHTGVVIAGGKGRASRRTPNEIEQACDAFGIDPMSLVQASRLSAKVDSSAVQDGFQVYQHTFLFCLDGSWAVIQQGMNENTSMARRYHWLTTTHFDSDPHEAVVGDRSNSVLNLVAAEAKGNRKISTVLARQQPANVVGEIKRMRSLEMPRRHQLRLGDIHPVRLERVLLKSYEAEPADYTSLLAVSGVGAKGLRALSLVAELAYGEPASVRDPASFSFAHGGKDGTPYPVDRTIYDSTIECLHKALIESRVGRSDKKGALERLARVGAPTQPGA
jgi:uncharacterized protein